MTRRPTAESPQRQPPDPADDVSAALPEISWELIAQAAEEQVAAEEEAAATAGKTAIDAEQRHTSRVRRRRITDAQRLTNARAFMQPLPKPDEAVHMLLAGNFNAWDFVPAVVQLVQPARVDRLVIATLSYNQANADGLFALLDNGQIGAVEFLCSDYFARSSGAEYEYLEQGLQHRGQSVAAARSHAKIIGFELSDGRRYVIESSANLRSCNNVEQATMFAAPHLYEFHRTWIRRAILEARGA